ncbi:Putative enoyl reductase [Psilocybe cubensis]|uniref:Enoyl reductase n=3 Tax=Psilocybe cubensis TaxID=181762 RepID=A0ACB8H1P0_PSICU|nr:Putative enoyl reductase [Psilocybe cubensis]KAH9481823.1 Putative enoyl reductase [Psilocybe cubensis]
MVQLTISAASKPPALARGLPLTIDVAPEATVLDVKRAIVAKYPKFTPSRQRITVKGDRKGLFDEIKLADVLSGKDGWEVELKDLGAQISWQTVFLVEYLGPMLIHPVFYHFPRLWYGVDVEHSALQRYIYAFVMLHFAKRELETLYVHRFSNDTMPWFNIFKNSTHYWILSGVIFAADIYRPAFSATSPYIVNTIRDNEHFLWIGAGLWAFAELSNLHTHLTVSALRPPGTRKRGIPYGYGFNLVSFPNYFFETLGWVVITGMSGSIGVAFFTVVSFYTMAIWAIKKHKNYKKEFGKEYPRNRKAIIPFIL